MSEKILFLTGRLAEGQLDRVLNSMQPAGFMYKTQQIGISVAALMTPKLIRRRVSEVGDADRILVPGRCRRRRAGRGSCDEAISQTRRSAHG